MNYRTCGHCKKEVDVVYVCPECGGVDRASMRRAETTTKTLKVKREIATTWDCNLDPDCGGWGEDVYDYLPEW